MKRLKHNLLRMAGLCVITMLCSGCMRFVESLPIPCPAGVMGASSMRRYDPSFISVHHPYFYGTRMALDGLVDSYEKAPGFIPFCVLSLPLDFAMDVIELPIKVVDDVTRPWFERQEHRKKLSQITDVYEIFVRGIEDKKRRRLFFSDDYLWAFKDRLQKYGIGSGDVELIISNGQSDMDYLALFLDEIVAIDKSHGLTLLSYYTYLDCKMLPTYRYLLAHGLKPSDYKEEIAIRSAVLNSLYMGGCESGQLELVKLLLEKGCNPNAVEDTPRRYEPWPETYGIPYQRTFTALDMACVLLELSKRKEQPDEKAVKTASDLVELLQRYGAMHSLLWDTNDGWGNN